MTTHCELPAANSTGESPGSTRRQQSGWWLPAGAQTSSSTADSREALRRVGESVYAIEHDGRTALVTGGSVVLGNGQAPQEDALPLLGIAPACQPEALGDASFCADHGIRFPFMSGSMANGIGSADIVESLGSNGALASFGAAGLSPERIEAAIDRLDSSMGSQPRCFNLIHSPNEPAIESTVVDLYLRRGVRLVEASAYLDLTLPLVRYRVSGIQRGADGKIEVPNRIISKVSRVEVAQKFFAPPPERLLRLLVEQGAISADQAKLAASIPMAQDLTAEADSGGHTDNRPALTLLPSMLSLRDRLQQQYGYSQPLRVGAAGGIATPVSAAAAFSMGAAYVLVGSVNQSCVESGSSDTVRTMLAEAQQADVTMAPAADMFEMGVKLQVLKRGTMFAMRAQKLYDAYRAYDSLDAIPATERASLEKTIFRMPLDKVWDETRAFFQRRDPSQVERALREPKHLLALVFRWYLGQSSRWANSGVADRRIDYQVWCGPAMGAFNEWTHETFLAQPENRRVLTVALNILHGAAVIARVNTLHHQGVALSPEIRRVEPIEPTRLQEYLNA